MNKEKLSVEHISGYLDHKLKCTDGELIGIQNRIIWSGVFERNNGSNYIPIGSLKPILRPLSDLVKEIEFEGHKVIPIVEILKELSCFDLSEQEFEYGKDDNEYWVNAVKLRNRVYDSITFDGNVFWILSYEEGWHVSDNQYLAIDFLNKYHFDWKYDLIKNGLAIDINIFNKK